jgi:multicomponent K+:H+ antiporter subunit A
MWAAPALLSTLVVLIGIMPALMVGPLVASASGAVIGGELPYYSLKIWHGVNTALFLSIAAVVGGLILLAMHRPLDAAWIRAPRPEAKAMFDALLGTITRASHALTDGLHNGAMPRYAAVFVLTVLAAGTTAWFGGIAAAPTREVIPITAMSLLGWLLLVVATLCMVAFHRNRLLSLVLMGIVGLMVSVAFIYMSAPDLALTQISVEVVTIILLLLALNFLPKTTPTESSSGRRTRDGIIAILGGLAVGGLTLAMLLSDFSQESISAFHLENSKPGGGGTNVVNVILVDFRGFDTFGEIIVLGIAALVIFAMTESVLNSPVGARLRQRPINPHEAGDRHPLMMVIATRVMMPIAVMVGVFIFLRGHNEPGGGFIAGLIVSIALVMQYMASGFDWAAARQRYHYHLIIGLGIFAAAFTGIASWFADRPFLTSNYGYFQIPPMGEFELATAMAFDVGVFLCVVGSVMLALESLSRFAHRAGERPSPYPMDIDPSRDMPQEAKDA